MILRYVARSLARRRLRSLMGVLGVFFTLALLTAVHAGLESVSLSYVELAALQAGKADLVVRAPRADAWAAEIVDPAAVERALAGRSEIRGFSPRLFGVRPVGKVPELRFALVIGIDPARERELGIDGFTPWPELKPGVAALSESLAGGLKAVRVAVGDVELDRGPVIERQLVVPQHVREFVVVDLETARKVLGEPRGAHAMAGAFRDPRSFYDARDLRGSALALKDAGEAAAEALGPDFAVTLPRAAAITAFEQAGGPVRAVFGIFAGTALAITALLVYSLISVSVEERIREHAILRTVGAKRRHIFGLVIAESAVVCAAGVVPGVFAGLLVARGLLALTGLALGGDASAVRLEVSGSTLALCLGAGAAVALAASLLPAMKSTRGRIVDALDPLRRGAIQAPTGEGGPARAMLLGGLALSAISGTVFFLLPTAVLSADPALIGGVALGLLVVLVLGFTLTAFAAAPLAERIVLALFGRLFGPAAELAGRNLARHRRRNATTSLLFALSVSFVIFMASLATLFGRMAEGFVDRRVGGDLRMSLPNPHDPAVAEELARIEGVARVARAAHLHSRSEEGTAYDVIASDLVGLKHVWISPVGADPGLAEAVNLSRATVEEGGLDAFRSLAEDPGEVDPAPAVASLSMARFLDVKKGDVVALSLMLGAQRVEARVRLAGVCSSLPGFEQFRARVGNAQGSGLLLSRKTFDRLTREAPREAFGGAAFVRTSGDPSKVAERIRERLGLLHGVGVECAADDKREFQALYWATQVLFSMMLAVAVTIALFGLVAAMATAAIERRREIGVLKAVGLRRGHLYRMFAAEAVTLTLSSGLLGGAMGFVLAWLFAVQAGTLMEAPTVFAPPWIPLAASAVICVFAGLAASWIPTRGLLRKPVAEILRG